MFHQSNQESEFSNSAISILCSKLDGCSAEEDADRTVDNLRNINAKDVIMLDAHCSITEPNWPFWTPVVKDGTFFTEDAEQKLKEGRVPSHINYIIGTNSYEGSLLWAQKGVEFTYENISSVFAITNGYEDDEITKEYR